ncbi:MAG TPA: LamG domain-containing protein [Kofleriaceae bacterium]|jgi:hypothetical protein
MRTACLLWLIAGCGFTSQTSPIGGDPGPGDVDGGTGGPAGPGGGSGTSASRCDIDGTGLGLRLCLTFDSPQVQDLVDPPHQVADTTGIQILRILSNATAKLDGNAHIRFMPSTDFDLQALTLELWIDPDKLAKGQSSATILERGQQYFVAYQQDGHLQCGIADQRVTSAVAIVGGWHHVACRFDAAHELRIYVDGSVSGCTQLPGGIPTGGAGEIAIGASYSASTYQNSYVGSLDNVHLFASALADADLCRAAHKTSCNTRCPEDGGRDPRAP